MAIRPSHQASELGHSDGLSLSWQIFALAWLRRDMERSEEPVSSGSRTGRFFSRILAAFSAPRRTVFRQAGCWIPNGTSAGLVWPRRRSLTGPALRTCRRHTAPARAPQQRS